MRCLKHPDEDDGDCLQCLLTADTPDGPRSIAFGDAPTVPWVLTAMDRAVLHRHHLAVLYGH